MVKHASNTSEHMYIYICRVYIIKSAICAWRMHAYAHVRTCMHDYILYTLLIYISMEFLHLVSLGICQ